MNNSKDKHQTKDEQDDEDDDIIINDDFDEETVVVRSMVVDLFKSKTLSQAKEDKTSTKDDTRHYNNTQSFRQEHNVLDSKDVDSELPFDSKLVYQEKNGVKEDYESKSKLTIDQVQSDDCTDNYSMVNQQKTKEDEKAKRVLKDIVNVDVHRTITFLLLEKENQTKKIKQLEEANLILNKTSENRSEEVLQLKNTIEMQRNQIKEYIITNKRLEEDLAQQAKNFKSHIINTKTISQCNNSLIKIEKQLAASFDQINRLTNENFFLKQTLHKLSTSPYSMSNMNLTNQVSLNSTLTSNPTNEKEKEILGLLNNSNTNKANSRSVTPNKKKNATMSLTHSKSNTIIPHCKPSVSLIKKNIAETGMYKQNTSFDLPHNRNDSFNESAKKETKILEIETSLYKLQKERDKLNEELIKLPEFPKQQNQIEKRKTIESAIEEFNNKINSNKQKLLELNTGV